MPNRLCYFHNSIWRNLSTSLFDLCTGSSRCTGCCFYIFLARNASWDNSNIFVKKIKRLWAAAAVFIKLINNLHRKHLWLLMHLLLSRLSYTAPLIALMHRTTKEYEEAAHVMGRGNPQVHDHVASRAFWELLRNTYSESTNPWKVLKQTEDHRAFVKTRIVHVEDIMRHGLPPFFKGWMVFSSCILFFSRGLFLGLQPEKKTKRCKFSSCSDWSVGSIFTGTLHRQHFAFFSRQDTCSWLPWLDLSKGSHANCSWRFSHVPKPSVLLRLLRVP